MTRTNSAQPNVNTPSYWNHRFASGDWDAKGGREQTQHFARANVARMGLPADFDGVILDFGCGLGDAMPVYREHYRHASLIGVDITEAAVVKGREKYGDIAEFINCDYHDVPSADVIVSCAVFEHLSNQMEVARSLLAKCTDLYIIVPYKEPLCPSSEHVNSYDEDSFRELGECDYTIFLSEGWSAFGWRLWFHVYLKNVFRPLLGRKVIDRGRVIMFHFCGKAPGSCRRCQ